MFLLTIVTITVFFSTIFSSQVVAGICSLLTWIALSALGSLGEIGNFTPSGLTAAAFQFFADRQLGWQHAWKALLGAGVLISASIGGGIAFFRGWEP